MPPSHIRVSWTLNTGDAGAPDRTAPPGGAQPRRTTVGVQDTRMRCERVRVSWTLNGYDERQAGYRPSVLDTRLSPGAARRAQEVRPL